MSQSVSLAAPANIRTIKAAKAVDNDKHALNIANPKNTQHDQLLQLKVVF